MNDNETNNLNLNLICGPAKFERDMGVFLQIIGQEEACQKLAFFVQSHSLENPFPNTLLTGSQGLGKTFIASKIAQSLKREFTEINCESLQNVKYFVENVLMNRVLGTNCKTILLDESHALPIEVSNILLSCLNPNKTNQNSFMYKNLNMIYDMTKINLVMATTHPHKMIAPLLNRMCEIHLKSYSQSDLIKIVNLYAGDIQINCNEEELAYACRGRARDAFLMAQNIKRYCTVRKISTLVQEDWNNIKRIFNIYPLGLTSFEVELLQKINEHAPISSKSIAMKMGVDKSNIEEDFEIRLQELDLITNTTKGRIVTEKGEKYLGTID